MKFKFLPHTADIKFQAFGNSIEKCFENAGYALIEVMYEGKKIKPVNKKKISVKGKDIENLLYNFLEEFLFLLDAKNFIVNQINNLKINTEKFQLTAELIGDKSKNYKFTNSVKAITYNDMWIKSPLKDGGNKFVCQVVVDV